jgi:PQQ-like domain
MRRFALVALILVAGCKKSKETQCDELAKLGVAFANEMGKQLGGKSGMGDDPEIKQKMAELKQQCMTWPDEVFECMRNNDETSPKCVEAMSHVSGHVANDLAKAPSGPPVVGSVALGEATWDGLPVSLAADGTLVAAPKDAIVAFGPDGNEQWRAAIQHDHWLLVGDGLVLAGDREAHALVALGTDGVEKWRAPIPAIDEDSDRTTEGAVKIGGKIYVPLADGRFLCVDPAACAKPKQKGCIEPAFALADETVDNPQLAAIGDDILIAESNAIRRISTTGAVLGNVHVRDDLGGVAVTGERVAAVMDDELVLWNFAACTGPSPIALRRKQGRMYMRGEGECEGECIAPPAGCLLARSELSDVDSLAPTVLNDATVVISNFDGPARSNVDGKKQWASEVDSIGPIREAGDTIVFVSRGEDAQAPRIVALDTQTGKAKWMTPLPGTKSTDLTSTTDVLVEVAGPWLVAIAKGHASWIKAR